MAITCPADFDIARLRRRVRETYERVAREPHGDFHFHRGHDYAVNHLGYDRTEVEALPRIATDAFAGVGNPLAGGAISAGETILDHACGGGMDLLLAARRTGPMGRAIGVDLTPGMVARARLAALEAGLSQHVEVHEGTYESLPVAAGSVDVVVSNGVVNLAPDKRVVMREIVRVLRRGGRLFLADVVVARELTLTARQDPDLWAACVAGALVEGELFALAEELGLGSARIVERYPAFAGTSAEDKVSKDLQVQGALFVATKL